jgi:hypothetical protein
MPNLDGTINRKLFACGINFYTNLSKEEIYLPSLLKSRGANLTQHLKLLHAV